jgi:hypothetical protein
MIHFVSCPYLAFYTLKARHQGLLQYSGKVIVSYLPETTQTIDYKKPHHPKLKELEIMFMENNVLRLAVSKFTELANSIAKGFSTRTQYQPRLVRYQLSWKVIFH